MLSSVLIPKLQARFPDRGLRVGSPPSPCAAFPAVHAEVGDVEIYDEGHELTLVAGRFTHGHFASYDESLSADQKAEEITERVVDFLEALFSDQVVLWGSHRGAGGWYNRAADDSTQASVGREREYVWSGPLG